MREGRGFLLSLTMTELLILLFFLLLLMAAGLIQHLQNRWEEAQEQVAHLHEQLDPLQEIQQIVEDNPEKDFVELVRIGGEASEIYEQLQEMLNREDKLSEIARMDRDALTQIADDALELERQLEELERRELALAEASDVGREEYRELTMTAQETRELAELREKEEKVAQVNDMTKDEIDDLLDSMQDLEEVSTLRQERSLLRGQIANLRRRCGNDYPPCWVRDERAGRPEYMYDVTIYDDHFIIKAVWPESRQDEACLIPGALDLPGEYWNLNEFRKKARPILTWSRAQDPDCRHYVKIRDKAMAKEPFLDRMTTVEEFFYKLLIRKRTSP